MTEPRFKYETLRRFEGRFWRRVDMTSVWDCWPWRLGKTRDGYGRFGAGEEVYLAHRVAWCLATKADTPENLVVMHDCDNPSCCNPRHLRLGTVAENVAERVARGRSAAGRKPAQIPIAGIEGLPVTVRTSMPEKEDLLKYLSAKEKNWWALQDLNLRPTD